MLLVVILIKSIIHPGSEPFMTDIIHPGIMQIRSAGQFQLRLYPPDIDKLGQRASSRYFIRVVKTASIGK